MTFSLLSRTTRSFGRDSTIETRPRIEVCPPALRQPAGLRRLGRWLRRQLSAPAPFDAASAARLDSRRADVLRAARADFIRELDGMTTTDADSLRCLVADSQSLRELWHLRSKVFGIVAVLHSQNEAMLRLERLNRHFPTRSPRSGLAPLDIVATLDRP